LDATQSEALRLAVSSLDGVVKIVRQAGAKLEEGAASSNGHGGPRAARTKNNRKPGV
jgi:hypothetical protein